LNRRFFFVNDTEVLKLGYPEFIVSETPLSINCPRLSTFVTVKSSEVKRVFAFLLHCLNAAVVAQFPEQGRPHPQLLQDFIAFSTQGMDDRQGYLSSQSRMRSQSHPRSNPGIDARIGDNESGDHPKRRESPRNLSHLNAGDNDPHSDDSPQEVKPKLKAVVTRQDYYRFFRSSARSVFD
jgi:hypothetical protein